MTSSSILVVGGGPVGLALALVLRRHGVAVRVLERLGAPSPHARASHLHGRVLEGLEGLGVVDALHARGRPSTGASLVSSGRTVAELRCDGTGARWGHSLAVPQPEVEAVLEAQLLEAGGEIARGVRVTNVRNEADHVFVEGEIRGHTGWWRAGWVIGCDGASSTVREALGVRLRGEVTNAPLVLGDFVTPPGARLDGARLHCGADGLALRIPLRDGERLVIELPDGVAASADALVAIGRRRIPELPALPAPTWWSPFRLHRLVAERWRVGRVLLAGDAAHLHSPVGAHGMNTGMLDALHLGWRLAAVVRGDASAAILDRWEAERAPAAADSVDDAWWASQALRLRGGPAGWLRDRLVGWAARIPATRRRIGRWSLALDADATDGWTRRFGGPPGAVGGRAIEVPTDDGWLLSPLRGRFGLVHRDPVPPRVIATLEARLGEAMGVVRLPAAARAAWGSPPPGTVFLVRPDGIVAYRGPVSGLGRATDALMDGRD